jgi:hypothetical protein
MLPTAKIFFDTQICINAANNVIPEADWAEATDYVHRVSDYCISPLSVGEVILSIARSDEQYFETCKIRLRKLYLEGKRTFFDFPRFFLAQTLGFKVNRPGHLEDNFDFSVQIVLLARSKSELLNGVTVPYLTKKVKIRIDRFTEEVEAIQSWYVAWMSQLKGTKKISPSPDEWAENALSFYGIEKDETAREIFLRSLPAAYQFELALFDLARNGNFDVKKNVSDLIDAQQLIYLCDPTVVFVTDDSDFKKRVHGNSQSARILSFRELLRRARTGAPLLQDHPTKIG